MENEKLVQTHSQTRIRMNFHSLLRTKPARHHGETNLKRCLSAFDLTLLGIGAIIGAGIFVLTGVAAATKAGPAIALSYVLAGIACSFAALAYAELASAVGGSGSAYTYGYVALGEIFAWIIGWDLILEYAISVCTVAIGWSGYINNAFNSVGIYLPESLIKSPAEGGIVNLLAVSIILILSAILALGVKHSARFNAVFVLIKLAAIALFIGVAIKHFNVHNWSPYMPFGWTGIVKGAALVFFAYIGFDAVSTASEEAIHPQRDMSIGIIASLVICTAIYIVVSGLLTGITSFSTLNNKSPIAETILNLGHAAAAGFIAVGAIAGLTSVMLIFIYGLSRIIYAISRDGLLPAFFSKVNPSTHTPIRTIVLATVIMCPIAGLMPIQEVAELVNIGTLAAFVIVCAGVVILRRTKPDLHRPFMTPFSPWLPILGILSCGYLMVNLPLVTWIRFVVWMAAGLIIYFCYSRFHSKLSKEPELSEQS